MTKIKSEYLGVDSSFISSLRYTHSSRKLLVFYKSGSAYEYSDVKPKTIDKIRKAKSIGVALHKYIFNINNFKKL
jgi:hypothetical protein